MICRRPLLLTAVFLLLSVISVNSVDRQVLIDYLEYKKNTRNTFDGRIDQQLQPIGYVAGKPVWPRIIEKAKSKHRIFFDDDNFAYLTKDHNLVDVIHRMDREENLKRVIKFLERYV
uniref:Secreted RxLR effector peptide protein n=1 Tax=Steinernema glaseri TaxID=37863 RepID=A0A1I7YXU0_9BILA